MGADDEALGLGYVTAEELAELTAPVGLEAAPEVVTLPPESDEGYAVSDTVTGTGMSRLSVTTCGPGAVKVIVIGKVSVDKVKPLGSVALDLLITVVTIEGPEVVLAYGVAADGDPTKTLLEATMVVTEAPLTELAEPVAPADETPVAKGTDAEEFAKGGTE